MGRSKACRGVFSLLQNRCAKAFSYCCSINTSEQMLVVCFLVKRKWFVIEDFCGGNRGGAGYWGYYSLLFHGTLSGAQWRVPAELTSGSRFSLTHCKKTNITMFKFFFSSSEMRSLTVLSNLLLTLGLRGTPKKMFLICSFYKY